MPSLAGGGPRGVGRVPPRPPARHLPPPPAAAPPAGGPAGSAAATPLLAAILERGGRAGEVPFHVPGHKRGAGAPDALRPLLADPLRYDLTELEGLDCLSSPTGPIQAAQRLAAEAWGASASWLLVNGTTVGVHAAVMATCRPGDALLLARNAHLSAFNAAALTGCTPVYAAPQRCARWGVAQQLTPAALRGAAGRAAAAGLRVGAALVVSPTYFGAVSDIAGLAAVCREGGFPLIVDEAHGAHLGLHPALPPSALASGAHLVVQSTHKLLGALTQAAMLHAAVGPGVDPARVSRALQVLQSSSPSYLLMASLDGARAAAADPRAWEEPLAAAAHISQGVAGIRGVRALAAGDLAAAGPAAGVALDPLRVTLSLRGLGLGGYAAAGELERRYGVVPELATSEAVVLALGVGSTLQHADALLAALRALSSERYAGDTGGREELMGRAAAVEDGSGGGAAEMVLTPREALFAATEVVGAEAAAGRVAAELLCPYPPGVPALLPGERVTAEILASLRALLAAGGKVTGCADASLATLRVARGDGLQSH